MPELIINDGRVSYSLNGKAEIKFNPTDSAFVEKLFNAFNKLDDMQKNYQTQAESLNDNKEIFNFAREKDIEMRAIIDDSLGTPVCDAVFGDMNIYALADGLPLWCNLLLSLMDEVDEGFIREQKASNPRIEKYTKKYEKYEKYRKV